MVESDCSSALHTCYGFGPAMFVLTAKEPCQGNFPNELNTEKERMR
jgi:hypothetical protein